MRRRKKKSFLLSFYQIDSNNFPVLLLKTTTMLTTTTITTIEAFDIYLRTVSEISFIWEKEKQTWSFYFFCSFDWLHNCKHTMGILLLAFHWLDNEMPCCVSNTQKNFETPSAAYWHVNEELNNCHSRKWRLEPCFQLFISGTFWHGLNV